MTIARLIGCLIFGFATVACSNQWREGGKDITAQDVAQIISEMESSNAMDAGGSGSLQEALALKDIPGASVYFADGYKASKDRRSPVGGVANVLGFFNFDFLGLTDVGYNSISEARVLFFDAPRDGGGRRASLILGMKKNGEEVFTYYAFIGDGDIVDDIYRADLQSGSGLNPISVQSYDVEDGLDTVIQLKVYDSAGGYLGKIATLVGFKY